MLSDIERKVLRIIANYIALRKRTPTIHELTVKTGRPRTGILKVLSVLDRERYIEWSSNDPERITLLEDQERKSRYKNPWEV